jgi:hypothetical protein
MKEREREFVVKFSRDLHKKLIHVKEEGVDSMFIKIYEYYIQPDKEQEYLRIQQKAADIYSRHIDSQSLHLKSKDEPSKWMEITRYPNEDEYKRSIKLINQYKEIQELFKEFQSLLVPEKSEIREEDFIVVKERNTY